MSLISVKNLKYKYPQAKAFAVDDVSFEIERGTYTAIVGFNGSGKSTIAKILCGLEESASGQVSFDRDVQLGIVFQSPKNQIVSGIVKRDTAFGPQNLNLPKGEIELRTIESLSVVEMLHKAEASTNAISLGQTQKIALAGMIAINPDILILDEATSMLDPESRKDIYDFLCQWHKQGGTIIQITHDLEVVKQCERVIGIEKGKIFFDGSREDYFAFSDNIFRINGNPLPVCDRSEIKNQKEVTLSLRSLNFAYGNNLVLNNVNLDLYKGTVTALTGPSGAGKSTLLELCSGLLEPQSSGSIFAVSRPVLAQQNAAAALFEAFAADDVAFGPRNKGMKGKALKTLVKQSMEKAALPFDEFGERHTFELSGGEQRRLSIAGILAMDTDIVLFDEPTAGLDSKAREAVMKMLRSLADEGKTVLFSTHKMDEADFADREIKVRNGELWEEGIDKEVTPLEQDESNGICELLPYPAISMLKGLKGSSSILSGEKNLKKKPLLHKIPAVVRILLFLAMFITSLCVRPVWACGSILVASIIYGLLAGFSVKGFLKACLKILPFLMIFAVLQLMFHPAIEGEVHFTDWKFLTITPSKLIFVLCSLLRTFASLACIFAFYFSTPEYDLIDGLSILLKPLALIKIPVHYFILIVEVMFRFVPLLIEEAESIIKTQIMRGGLGEVKGKMAKIKAIVPLIVPMIIQTIKRSEALADAITMRCFK